MIVNVAGETIREFAQLAELLEGVPGVAGIEVNVSCPNVQARGEVFGASAATVADVTTAVRRETTLPVIVKLSPNSGDARPTALAAASSGADAISLINTITSMGIDIKTRRPALAHGTGGLSGPAIKPIALRMVYEVARELRLSYPHVPVIGIGGISNTRDALEFIMAGASAIQIGTINFVNPRAGVEIIEGIEDFLSKEGGGGYWGDCWGCPGMKLRFYFNSGKPAVPFWKICGRPSTCFSWVSREMGRRAA